MLYFNLNAKKFKSSLVSCNTKSTIGITCETAKNQTENDLKQSLPRDF